jgi:hypothetical protein
VIVLSTTIGHAHVVANDGAKRARRASVPPLPAAGRVPRGTPANGLPSVLVTTGALARLSDG